MEISEADITTAYISEKLSEEQIRAKFNISLSTVRKVLNKNKVKRRTRSEASRYLHVTKFGRKDFLLKEDLNQEEQLLKIAGVMLYWGEGTKNGNTVALSNSNPKIIKVFLRFLRIVCGISEERIHITLHYYEDHNPKEIMQCWSDFAQVPLAQFYKPYLHRRQKGTYRNPSKYGTVSVQYSDKRLLGIILKWIEEYEDICEGSIT